MTSNLGRRLSSARGKHCANFIFLRRLRSLSKHPSPSEHRIRAKRVQWFTRIDTRQTSSSRSDLMGDAHVRRPYQEPSMPQMRSNDVVADHRAGKPGFRFADFRMPEMLRHRNVRGVDFPRDKCLYRAGVAGSQATGWVTLIPRPLPLRRDYFLSQHSYVATIVTSTVHCT